MKASPNPQGPMYRLGQLLGVLLVVIGLLALLYVAKLLVLELLG